MCHCLWAGGEQLVQELKVPEHFVAEVHFNLHSVLIFSYRLVMCEKLDGSWEYTCMDMEDNQKCSLQQHLPQKLFTWKFILNSMCIVIIWVPLVTKVVVITRGLGVWKCKKRWRHEVLHIIYIFSSSFKFGFFFYVFSSLSLLGFVELANIMTECSCYCFSCGKLSMKNIDFCTLLWAKETSCNVMVACHYHTCWY